MAHTRTGHGVPALLGLLTGLALLGCGGSSAPTATPTSASSASAPATSAPATASATPSPSAAATPTAAAISLSCPSASDVSTDFQTPFTALPPGAGDALVVNGEPPPGGASVSQCTYTDSAISASVVILLATGYPAADFATAEQDITHNTVGGTVTGSETFDPQSGLGDQAVAYDFTLSTSSGTNYEFGTIAIQGTNLVSVLGYGTTFTPDQQMFNTLIEALLA